MRIDIVRDAVQVTKSCTNFTLTFVALLYVYAGLGIMCLVICTI